MVEGDMPKWTTPDEVMKLYKFKLRKAALTARFNNTQVSTNRSIDGSSTSTGPGGSAINQSFPGTKKRKNPFLKQDPNKRQKESPPTLDSSCGDSTFDLLNIDSSMRPAKVNTEENCNKVYEILKSSESVQTAAVVEEEVKGSETFPVNWSLKTRMRIMSSKPFPWKSKLHTRPYGRFFQSCKVWQHPHLPEFKPEELLTRKLSKVKDIEPPNKSKRDAMFKQWRVSFESLLNLLRGGQCPFFYLCCSNFKVLFRAAGICGISEIQALITPTNKGLRELLKKEGIEFTMPLETRTKKIQSNKEENDEWLKSVGIDEAERRKINFSQSRVAMKSESDVDNLLESLIFVTGGVEAKSLFNFLINCKTIMTCSGPFAGIPPTLLSPVDFPWATSTLLEVKENTVTCGVDEYYSLKLEGPILPYVLPSLCSLMTEDHGEKFSVTWEQERNTVAFSLAKHGIKINEEDEEKKDEKLVPNVFAIENLKDSGLNESILKHFCDPNPDYIQNFESLTCENHLYKWT